MKHGGVCVGVNIGVWFWINFQEIEVHGILSEVCQQCVGDGDRF